MPASTALKAALQGHLGLAESHVAADQAVHGLVALHVLLGIGNGGQLVRGLLEQERLLEGFLQMGESAG